MATLKNILFHNKKYALTTCLLLLFLATHAQNNGPLTLSSPNTTGNYSSGVSITLSNNFTTTGPFRAFIQVTDCLPLTTAASANQNYVITNTPRVAGIISESQLLNRTSCDLMQTIQYTDGLGRPMQSIQVMGSPLGQDVVQPIAYDAFGRELKKYLPYVPTSGVGTYRSNALTSQPTFYQNQSDQNGIVQIPSGQVAYSETLPENSPLGRPLEQGAPGLSNQVGGGHTVTTAYLVNKTADAVKMWQVGAAGGASYTSSYPEGSLTKTVTTDENQNNNSVITFKDKEDRVVSRWVQNGVGVYYVTDYIYDDMNHLRYVVPPLPQTAGAAGNAAVSVPASFTETDAVFQNFFYAYHYDGLNRLIEKKIPGQGWQYMVYNKMDQPILTQDANQLSKGIWMITKYDALGRVIMTGWFTASSSRQVFQNAIDGVDRVQYDTFTNATTNFGYDNASYPDLNAYASKILTVHYYDTYDILNNTSVNPNTGIYTPPSIAGADTLDKAPRSLPVATFTNILGTNNYLFSVMHYDGDGRAVKVTSQHYQGGTIASNKYDTEENTYSFQSLPVQSVRKHYLPAGLQVTINSWNAYDHSNRPLTVKQQYNGGNITTLSKSEYNEMGQVTTKNLHALAATSTDNSSYLQHIDMRYNARGWLSRINSPSNLIDERFGNTDLFAERLDYDQNNTGYMTTPNYNGNISSVSWQTKLPASVSLPQEQKGYSYTYDPLNRLTNAYSKAATSGNDQYNETLSYDELGNILNLTRKNGVSATLNSMSYSYMNAGNRSNKLNSIIDAGTEAINTTYTYDSNGNQTADTKKTVSNIVYNELNLPQTVSITANNKTLTYTYDATGTKLQRIININGTIAENRTYANGIEYNGNSIELIHTPEGRALPSSGAYVLEYNVTDHLGNIRGVFGDKNNDGTFTTSDIVQTSDYYAFGREIGYSQNYIPSPDNKYKYNGKEFQADLAELDYGARFYDPVIGRMTSIDPKAELSRRYSTYTYGNDNPIRFIDPDGMFSTDVTENKDGTYKVVNAKADGDKNVYVVKNANSHHNASSRVIAKTVTDHSFLEDNGKAAVGARIDLSDKKGADFLNNKIIGNTKLGILDYMHNAHGGQKYDFKTNGPNGETNGISGIPSSQQEAYKYRGGVVDGVPGLSSNSDVPTVASARDIGNIAAGYIAGENGVPWGMFRWKADGLQSTQDGHPSVEGQTTQLAEKVGYKLGFQNKVDNMPSPPY